MINRYILEAYVCNHLIFQCECRTINQVAKICDCFYENGFDDLWFDCYDQINNRSMDVKELMRIWHGEQLFD